jgi:hypothetical protein
MIYGQLLQISEKKKLISVIKDSSIHNEHEPFSAQNDSSFSEGGHQAYIDMHEPQSVLLGPKQARTKMINILLCIYFSLKNCSFKSSTSQWALIAQSSRATNITSYDSSCVIGYKVILLIICAQLVVPKKNNRGRSTQSSLLLGEKVSQSVTIK